MATHYRTRALVLKKEDSGESGRVFTVFAKNFGKLQIFGKAIRKIASKLKSGIDLFSLSEIEFIQGKNRKTLTDAVFVEKFRYDLEKIKTAVKVSEVLGNLLKGQEKDDKLWNLVDETFRKINSESRLGFVYYFFLWNFFSVLGHGPEISKCTICSAKLDPCNLYFSIKDGGAVCKNCGKSAEKINSDVVKILRIILSNDWGTFLKLKIAPSSMKILQDLSKNYYFYILSNYV